MAFQQNPRRNFKVSGKTVEFQSFTSDLHAPCVRCQNDTHGAPIWWARGYRSFHVECPKVALVATTGVVEAPTPTPAVEQAATVTEKPVVSEAKPAPAPVAEGTPGSMKARVFKTPRAGILVEIEDIGTITVAYDNVDYAPLVADIKFAWVFVDRSTFFDALHTQKARERAAYLRTPRRDDYYDRFPGE